MRTEQILYGSKFSWPDNVTFVNYPVNEVAEEITIKEIED